MNRTKTFIISLIAATFTTATVASDDGAAQKAKNLDRMLHERDEAQYKFSTKFGFLKFVRDDGTLGLPAKAIMLDEKILVSTKGETNKQGGTVSLLTEIMSSSSREVAVKQKDPGGKSYTQRMVVLVGEDGNCTKQFVILDFTGNSPFVSSRFGDNPEDRYCLKFKRAKWGKDESLIYLEGPMTYVYNKKREVFGPVE